MFKFKPGDRVRCILIPGHYHHNINVGDVCIIRNTKPVGQEPWYYVQEDSRWDYEEKCFEFVSEVDKLMQDPYIIIN
jgi:hypothetical protein